MNMVRNDEQPDILQGYSLQYLEVGGGRIRVALRANDRSRRSQADVEYAWITDRASRQSFSRLVPITPSHQIGSAKATNLIPNRVIR